MCLGRLCWTEQVVLLCSSSLLASFLEHSYINIQLLFTFLTKSKFIEDHDNPKYPKESRGKQENFKNNLFKKYGCCVISGTKSKLELQAAHIIPYCEDKKNIYNFSPSNGLLLKSNLHATFDGLQWSINPDTFCIEVKNKSIDDLGEINDYKNNEVQQLDKTDTKLKKNLENHYHKFINSF